MIISKDLFLLGEQDYLRLPKDEKRLGTSNNTTVAPANSDATVPLGDMGSQPNGKQR